MTISHRGADASAAQKLESMKVARLSCCCKLSDLLPLVQQIHQQVRAAQPTPDRNSEAA